MGHSATKFDATSVFSDAEISQLRASFEALLRNLKDEKGSWTERESFVKTCRSAPYNISLAEFIRHLASFLTKDPTERFIEFLQQAWPRPRQDPFDDYSKPNKELKMEEFLDWFPKSLWLPEIWLIACETIFYGQSATLKKYPRLLRSSGGSIKSLLDPVDVFLLNVAISAEHQVKEWGQVFSTKADGKSWSTLATKIEDAGSVLVIIKDERNHIFGAFASEILNPGPKFKGNSDCFLFTLQPHINVFKPSGINTNYQYFNYGTSTLPNGLGFGGQLEFFGLWVDAQLDKGHCRGNPSSTYENPPLAGLEEFLLDTIECLLVKPKEVDDRLIDKKKGKKSVLNYENADTSLLEMGGRTFYSKNVQPPKPDEPLE
ncbi:hypothetical protein HDU97_002583 [Phlyctochytrium planicorne]|nr:hypothetical protein HDU97_002583 [Phlyctochytrium planicorne]